MSQFVYIIMDGEGGGEISVGKGQMGAEMMGMQLQEISLAFALTGQ